MALTESNVSKWIDGEIEIDVSGNHTFAVSTTLKAGDGSHCEVVQYSVSGGETRDETLQMACGNDYTSPRGTNPLQIDVQLVYTIGETTDVWAALKAKQGTDIAVRVKPDGTDDYSHGCQGLLRAVPPPTPNGGRYTYQFSVKGTETYGAVV